MPLSCCVTGCKSKGNSPHGVLFFQLPLNKPTVLTQWLIVLDRRDWIPKPTSRICSLHFAPDDYVSKPNQTPRLKPDAIPSVFPDLDGDEEPTIKEEEVEEEEDKPIKNKTVALVSSPVTVSDSPSQRPRRAPKVSSKMKDYILLDEIKKKPTVVKSKSPPKGDEAAQELLSILEDSNSADEDSKSSPSTSKDDPVFKYKPAPASVKRAKELEFNTQNKITPKKQVSKSKSVPLAVRKKYFPLKEGEKTFYLSYEDLNPVTDMTKDNALFSKDDMTTSDPNGISPEVIIKSEPTSPNKNSNQAGKKPKEAENEIIYNLDDDSDVIDSDSGLKTLIEKGIVSPAITRVSKNFKVTSPVKRKKRFKTVAEIVVRTDNSGQVPSVSIEKMTSLDNIETPRKKPKIAIKPAPTNTPILPHTSPGLSSEDGELTGLADRITDTIKKMKLLEKVKGNTNKLTVLITTLPPVQENELLIIKKKNTETNVEQCRELKVAISSHKGTPSEANQNNSQNDSGKVPIVGACDSEAGKTSTADKEASGSGENSVPSNQDPSTSKGKDGAPLVHDHTYISPSMKTATEGETTGDERSREMFSKLKLSDEEISYRAKVHKKLRFLKETVHRKNEAINKLKQKIVSLEKSLRDERKSKRKFHFVGKRIPGMEYGYMDENGSKNMEYQQLQMELEENIEESDDEGRNCNSPITYICEPAIDVCEKTTAEE